MVLWQATPLILELKSLRLLIMIKKNGKKLSHQLGKELFSMRKHLAPKIFSVNTSLVKAKKLSQKTKKPILIADIWDNPGGGCCR